MPRKLTAAQVAKMVNSKQPGAWKGLTREEREQLTEMMNAEKARKEREEVGRKSQSAAVDRFMERFWAPVRKEQRTMARKKKR